MAVLQATEISGSITLSQPLRVPALSNTAIGNLSAQEKENFDNSIKAVKELFDAAQKIDPDLK